MGQRLIWDSIAVEFVPPDEYRRRQAERSAVRARSAIHDGRSVERGHWIYDREAKEIVTAEEYFSRKARRGRGHGLQVISDIEPFLNVAVDGKVVGGRRQRRDMMRAYGLTEVGHERLPPRQPIRPDPVAPDIKRAIAEVQSR